MKIIESLFGLVFSSSQQNSVVIVTFTRHPGPKNTFLNLFEGPAGSIINHGSGDREIFFVDETPTLITHPYVP